ncbi:MAG: RHS repeat-associated core domain-containing protein, partial [Clostridia bacterium]|nr:RHS repeat-associated core domain-containing protein [Clostridia bacterium]
SDTSGIDLGNVNPIRYRGYYYDTETGFYYLQSRYYCPKIGRFLNADVQLNGQEGLTGYNLFQYCGSNPIIRSDKSGTKYTSSYERTTNESANSLLGIFVTLVITWAVCNLFSTTASTATTYYAPSISIPKVEKKEKSIVCDTPKKSDEPVIFPVDPHAFNPNGLIKVPRTGTKNGALISWMDPLTKTEVFRWDENPNYPNGSHYHVIGTGHFIPGVDEVPEPFATIYFLFE